VRGKHSRSTCDPVLTFSCFSNSKQLLEALWARTRAPPDAALQKAGTALYLTAWQSVCRAQVAGTPPAAHSAAGCRGPMLLCVRAGRASRQPGVAGL